MYKILEDGTYAKTCSKCHKIHVEAKPESFKLWFAKQARAKDGYQSICRVCSNTNRLAAYNKKTNSRQHQIDVLKKEVVALKEEINKLKAAGYQSNEVDV